MSEHYMSRRSWFLVLALDFSSLLFVSLTPSRRPELALVHVRFDILN